MSHDRPDPLPPPPPAPLPPPAPATAPASGAPAFDRRRLIWLLVPIGLLVVAQNLGTVLSARLVNDHPLVLLGLDARLRHLLLAVAADVNPVGYFLVGFARLVVSDPLFYLLGYWFGDAGLRWLEARTGSNPAYVVWMERWFPRLAWPLVALMPNNLVCLLAGTSRMRPRTFLILNVGGTVVRLVAVWFLGQALEEPLDVVLDWVGRYQWPLTFGLLALVVLQSARQAARSELAATRAAADDPPPPPASGTPPEA